MSDDTTAMSQPLHGPIADRASAPSLDIAMALARAALDRHANANIHDGVAMMQAAAAFDYVLRDVLAAVDAERGEGQ